MGNTPRKPFFCHRFSFRIYLWEKSRSIPIFFHYLTDQISCYDTLFIGILIQILFIAHRKISLGERKIFRRKSRKSMEHRKYYDNQFFRISRIIAIQEIPRTPAKNTNTDVSPICFWRISTTNIIVTIIPLKRSPYTADPYSL